ncbi:MAG: glycosyltransferase [Planctomycetes bacterium]|nr:glycosyltransferase [Planctomycetota bacterium]
MSAVIPGRNCAATIEACLAAIVAIGARPGSPLEEIIFVDDGSTDDTAAIAGRHPVTVLAGTGSGAGSARNLGWRAARGDLVWFVDSDCVAAPDALEHLVGHLEAPDVAAVSGTYGNANADSLLPCLIHEEIVQRHLAMGEEVDFLATFNVLYRRSVLADLDGFDERYLKAQDAELSFRARDAGGRLRFEARSRVDHYHEQRLGSYLRTQRQQGYWRVWLHLEHPGRAGHNSYSNALDHVQPMLAMALLASLPLAVVPYARWTPVVLLGLLLVTQIPMTTAIVRRTGRLSHVLFAGMSAVRAVWRGVGMTHGVLAYLLRKRAEEPHQVSGGES